MEYSQPNSVYSPIFSSSEQQKGLLWKTAFIPNLKLFHFAQTWYSHFISRDEFLLHRQRKTYKSYSPQEANVALT